MTDTSVAAFLERGLLASHSAPLSFWESVGLLAAILPVAVAAAWGWSRLAEAAIKDDAGNSE